MPAPDALSAIVTGGAFALGIVFGAVALRANFCTMGAIADIANFGDWRRMRMWALAIAVAIAGTAVLQSSGAIDLSKSLYTGARVAWLSLIVGGFLFGFGMTLGSGCGSKTLIRLGAGNLKSLIVALVLAISAYMTLKGMFAFGARLRSTRRASSSAPPHPICRRFSAPRACRPRRRGCRGRSQ
jgi:uncharacterized membrane protein YedE/YeeE